MVDFGGFRIFVRFQIVRPVQNFKLEFVRVEIFESLKTEKIF